MHAIHTHRWLSSLPALACLLLPIALLGEATPPAVVLIEAPPEAAELAPRIEGMGAGGAWHFDYGGGFEADDLYLPVDTPVFVRLRTAVPGYRLVLDDLGLDVPVPPGGPTTLWLSASGEGPHALGCGECDAEPEASVELLDGPSFRLLVDTWNGGRELSLGQRGELLFERFNCSDCHRPDGRAAVAGSPRGLWGTQLVMEDGSTVDVSGDTGRAFLQRSIVDPHAQYTAGYMAGAMPDLSETLSDTEVDALVQFLRCMGASPCSDPQCAGLRTCVN